ncbi:GerAB/ArcD/ProY family transporter [Fonticella tunisiensis]|uniref:Spore germination protein n=1 Tax=Fonticella tunisiensis TaxID=1096341 RepID=A0A4R7KS08_9CLOT|nr:endospore germination permease [Fonticella tunisiensis]TDT62346.1 spore germination protein [Fonticella tunisiensis]
MTPNDDKISSIQLGVFIYNTILGVGILTLPASLAKEVEAGAWVLAILSGLVNIIFIYFMCKVGEKYSEYGFAGALRRQFGKVFGTILAIPVLVYFVVFTAIVLRIFAETIKLYLLSNTPLEFIIFPLIILAIVLARTGVEPSARFFESVTPLIILILVFLMFVALPKSDFTNLRPVFSVSPVKYITGLKSGAFAYSGYEILLIIFPFLRKPEKAFKVSSIALIIITLFYTIIVMETLAKFGSRETASLIYPTVNLIKASEIPGGFIERLEGLLMALWVIFVFTTVVSTMYGASVIGGDILNQKEKKHIVSIFLPLIYILSLTGESVVELFKMSDTLTIYLGTYTIIIVPIIMFIASLLDRKGGKKGEA